MEKINFTGLYHLGITLVIIGILVIIISKTGYPKLPGDFYIKRGNLTLATPITSSIIISLLLTLIFRLINICYNRPKLNWRIMPVSQKESGLLLGDTPNETVQAALEAVQELFNPGVLIEFTDERIANHSIHELFRVASGEARFNCNPIAGSSLMHEWIGSSDLPQNGHDYI